MVDVKALRHAMLDANCTARELAKACKLSPAAMYRRFSGKIDFNTGEVILIQERLHLTAEQRQAIFFAENVS